MTTIRSSTIEDATDFWQRVSSTANVISGEGMEVVERQLTDLHDDLSEWLRAHPEITNNIDRLDNFAMSGVNALIDAVLEALLMQHQLIGEDKDRPKYALGTLSATHAVDRRGEK
jgi:hypothetical protein